MSAIERCQDPPVGTPLTCVQALLASYINAGYDATPLTQYVELPQTGHDVIMVNIPDEGKGGGGGHWFACVGTSTRAQCPAGIL